MDPWRMDLHLLDRSSPESIFRSLARTSGLDRQRWGNEKRKNPWGAAKDRGKPERSLDFRPKGGDEIRGGGKLHHLPFSLSPENS
jgi:hypothetical protein